MPQPDVPDVHVNSLVTNLSIAHMNQEKHYIADKMFPMVPSDKQSDLYLIFQRGDFFQGSENATTMQDLLRAPGTRAAIAGYDVSSASFRCDNFAIGVEIPDELRGNADAIFQLDDEAALLATQIQLIRRERAWALDFMKSGVWGTDVAGTTDFVKWSDYGGSDPLADMELALDTIEAATGQRPNKCAMGPIVWRRLKYHPDLVDLIKGGATPGQPAKVMPSLLAQLLEIDEVLIGRASYRSSVEGANLAMARIFDDDMLFLNVAPSPGRMTPTAGITYFWKPLTGGNIQFARKYRQDPEKKDVIEIHSYMDHVATETESGYFLGDCVD